MTRLHLLMLLGLLQEFEHEDFGLFDMPGLSDGQWSRRSLEALIHDVKQRLDIPCPE